MGRKRNNFVLSEWKGISYIRSKPFKMKQTDATIKTADIFGMAANRSKILRSLLSPLLPDPKNRECMQRVDTAFRQWLYTEPLNLQMPVDAIPFFNGLSFNEQNELKQLFKIPVTTNRQTNGQLQFHIPAFDPLKDIKAPDGTKQVLIKIAAAAMQIDNPSIQDYYKRELSIAYVPGTINPQDIAIPVETARGRLSVVALAMQYFTDDNGHASVDQLRWKPAGIVGSFYN